MIMIICMSTPVFSCIFSIRRISAENEQSDSMILAHMVNNAIENDPNDIWYQHFLDQNQSYKLEVDTDMARIQRDYISLPSADRMTFITNPVLIQVA